VLHPIHELYRSFSQVFQAIEKNAGGRYRIVTDPKEKDPRSYLALLDIRGHRGQSIIMPPVFQDTFRDLLANARKYSPPGSTIRGQLWETGEELGLRVEDEGEGIPRNELEQVIRFGYRAGNVSKKKSMGGGFGLTKAYFVTKSFNGRMWIDSDTGSGTRVEIRLPTPKTE
jgi:signal transduction histidine kinase